MNCAYLQLPSTLPDETLFSRYVRHMTILDIRESEYLKLLFSKPRASIHPYLTIGITKASQISEDSESKIYKEQTLGRFFSYFLPDLSTDIYAALLADDGNVAVRTCQLVSFKESELLSLKYCPACAKEDMWNYGVSYWHRVHQIPGIEACPSHKVWLAHQKLPERPHIKRGLLPDTSVEARPCSVLSYKFAQFIDDFLINITNTNESLTRTDLLKKVRKRGYMLSKNRFKRAELTADLYSFTQSLKYDESDLLPSSKQDYRYLSYLLSGQVYQNPFKHLLVNFWLSNIYENTPPPSYTITKNDLLVAQDKLKLKCLKLLKQGNSLVEVSRVTGKSRCYLKSIAMRENITIITHPIIITGEVIKDTLTMANKGFHRRAIANRFNISTGSVEQIISSEQGLVEKRKLYKLESKRRRYKVQILRALNKMPFAIKQEIKETCYAAFHWLYTHEKIWLNSTLPSPKKQKVHSKVNWIKRDIELAPIVNTIM
jgi:hypothetical protein